MPMTTIAEDLPVCDCCIIALANGDTSGCEYGCGDADDDGLRHVDRLCEWGTEQGEDVVPGHATDPTLARCYGCGDDVMSTNTVAVLAPMS